LVAIEDRAEYQRVVRGVFSGPGRGIGQVLRHLLPSCAVDQWLFEEHLNRRQLPRDLLADQWASLFRIFTGLSHT
jgi:23S rRNA (adenine-N6)-dimethyltransferase